MLRLELAAGTWSKLSLVMRGRIRYAAWRLSYAPDGSMIAELDAHRWAEWEESR